jgi:uncharacterized protein YigE (DUF2233 family)
MKKILLLLFLAFSMTSYAQTSADVCFQISTVTTMAPPIIKLTWRKTTLATTYNVFRKLRTETNWTSLAANLAVNDTTYTDNTVLPE